MAVESRQGDVRLELRQERSVKILKQFHDCLEEQAARALPKNPIGQAIGYARSNWEALQRYAAFEFLDKDSNASERAMKASRV